MLTYLNPVVFRTVGWVLASIGYNSVIGSLPAGPVTDLVRTLDLVLTPQVKEVVGFSQKNLSFPQAIAQTLVRDALRTVWDLAARIVTTATLFGVFDSVRIVLSTNMDFSPSNSIFLSRCRRSWQTQR